MVDSCTQDPIQRETFELICVYAGRSMSKIPIDFLIGFYVQQVNRIYLDIIIRLRCKKDLSKCRFLNFEYFSFYSEKEIYPWIGIYVKNICYLK